MTTIRHLVQGLLFSSFVWLMGLSQIAAAATPEQLLADINRLPANERQARLEKGAKQEGSVVWYAAMNRNELNELKLAFEAEYPFIALELVAGRSRDLVSRALTENRAGKIIGDIINANSLYLDTLVKAKAVSAYRTPYRSFFATGSTTSRDFSTASIPRRWCSPTTRNGFPPRRRLRRLKIWSSPNGRENSPSTKIPTTG